MESRPAEPRRVLLVTGLVSGGIGAHVAGLAEELTRGGHQVVAACPRSVADRFGFGTDGVPVVDLPLGSLPSPGHDLVALVRLRSAGRGADVVHAHGVRAGALSALALRRRGRAGRPALVVTLHNAPPQGRPGALAHWVLHRVACRGADEVLAVSTDLGEAARGAGARAVTAAVVAAPRPRPHRDPAAVREEIGVPAGTPLLVSVGRLAPQKGYDLLLEALHQLPAVAEPGRAPGSGRARPTPPGVLVVAGEGPQRRELEEELRRRPPPLPVRLVGHRTDVADLLAAADLAVSPARWEGQPVWLQEALALGVPVLATDVGGTAQLVGGGGLLVPGEDPRALAEALGQLLGDAAARERLAERARCRSAELPGSLEACRAARAAYRRARSRVPGVPQTSAEPT